MNPNDGRALSADEPPSGAAAAASARARAAAAARLFAIAVDALPALGSRHAFRLTGEGRVWLVLGGALDLFLTDPVDPAANAAGDRVGVPADDPAHDPVHDPGTDGRRRFIATVPTGFLCVGFAQDAPLAVPQDGTTVYEVTLGALVALAARDQVRDAVAAAVAAWVERLARAAYDGLPPPTTRVVRDPGALAVAAGDLVQAARGCVLWAACDCAEVRIGPERAAAPAPGLRVALTDRAWLAAGAAGQWDLATTAGCMTEATFAAGLQWFQTDAIGRIKARMALCAVQDRDRAGAAERAAGGRFTDALRGLAEVLRRGGRRSAAVRSDAPAIAAMQLAAAFLGLPPPADERLEPALAARDPLLALSQRTGIALRTVELSGTWWCDDHGALLATRHADGTLALLLPRPSGAYDCIDPVSGAAVPVDPAVAASLNSTARALYRPFPDGLLSPTDILVFGFRGSLREVFYALVLVLAIGFISLVVPVFTGWILDPIIPQADTPQLLVLVVAVLIAGFTQQGFSLIQSLYLLRVEGRVGNAVQAAVWDRLLRLPASFFQRYSAGDLESRAMGVDAMRQQLSGSALAAVTHGVIGAFSLGLMLYYDWRLSLAAALVVLVYVVIAIVTGRWVLRFNRDQLRLSGQLQGLLLQLLGAVGKLRVGGAERNAFARWAATYAELQGISYNQQVLNNRLVVFKAAFNDLAILLIILVLAWQGGALLAFYQTPQTWADINNVRLQTLMPTAQFVPFYAAFGQFMGAAFGLATLVVQLTNIPAYYERFAPILSATPESVNGADPGVVRGDIAVNAVTFRYTPEGPLVLRGVSLQASAGEFVAVVGPSGAGKSSLVRLLLGFDPPASGSLFLDGRDLVDLDKRLMRQSFGVVLQNGRLLAGSIYQNIVAGAQLTRDQAMEAARLAGLDADIAAMPMGLDTYLSEGAATLSGGQRQRLMIARAIVHRPKVVIFDEATSALDNITQDTVTRSLETLNSTRIVIAHRLSTIIRADRIYVIDKGHIVETGTYETLMAQDGLFAAMARRQVI